MCFGLDDADDDGAEYDINQHLHQEVQADQYHQNVVDHGAASGPGDQNILKAYGQAKNEDSGVDHRADHGGHDGARNLIGVLPLPGQRGVHRPGG